MNKETQQAAADFAWRETNSVVDDIERSKVTNITWRCDSSWVTDFRGSMEDVIQETIKDFNENSHSKQIPQSSI